MKIKQFEVYKTRLKQYRWRARATNGEILAQGESYKRRIDCMAVVEAFRAGSTAPVVT